MPIVSRQGGRTVLLTTLVLSIGWLVWSSAHGENTLRSSAARFIKVDTTTQGDWKGVYGSEGYNIVEHAEKYPAYVKLSTNERLREIWSPSTRDRRALLKKDSEEDRFIGRWYRWSRDHWTMTLQFTDDQPHQVAIYCVDWEEGEPRIQKIEVLDAFRRAVLDSQTVSSFTKGKYLVWNLKGTVTLRFSQIEGDGSVMSGLFFDKAAVMAEDQPRSQTNTITAESLPKR